MLWQEVFGVARLARILLIGATVAAGLGTASIRAQTVLEDPKNAAKIFAGTCSACHKSPQGLAKRGGTASFLREHYTTGPEMSTAMAAYLAAAGNGPPAKNTEKQKEAGTPGSTKAQKREHVTTEAGPEGTQRPSLRKQRNAKGPAGEPPRMAAHPIEPTPLPPERPTPPPEPASTTAALSTPSTAPAPVTPSATAEPEAPPITLDLPEPPYPTEAPADLRQPSAFSSAPLP
jgi:hypothetical protein